MYEVRQCATSFVPLPNARTQLPASPGSMKTASYNHTGRLYFKDWVRPKEMVKSGMSEDLGIHYWLLFTNMTMSSHADAKPRAGFHDGHEEDFRHQAHTIEVLMFYIVGV